MFSRGWFDTFASTVSDSILEIELTGIARAMPPALHPRVLDVGCGIGRIAGPLASRGYDVTGIDVSVDALRRAGRVAPGPTYVALDQRHVGRLPWRFDGVLSLWHSLGFVGPDADLEMLTGIARVLRPGGRLVVELFHPDWLRDNPRTGERDPRGASVRRWMDGARCHHEIRYDDGTVDRIVFSIYAPASLRAMVARAGLEPIREMVWWDPARSPSRDEARYQLVCARAG